LENHSGDLFLMIAVFGALEEEIRECRKGMQIQRVSACQGYKVWEGKFGSQKGLLILTGVGKERAQQAADRVMNKYPVRLIMSTGFGGGLNEKTKVGDIVICSRLRQGEIDSQYPALEKDIGCDSSLVDQSRHCSTNSDFRLLNGNGVTIAGVCATAEAKYKLGREFKADVVDMESYWIGQKAVEKEIPFIAIRSILDSARDDLSFLERLTVNGRIAPLKALGQLLTHPHQLKEINSLYHNSRKAARNLAVFIGEMLEGL
jgi:adenosylhomocysteine nucleosidase